jgi:uncharacterized membrane protein YkoI
MLCLAMTPSVRAGDAVDVTAPDALAPIDEALAVVQRTHPGRVLKVELEDEDDVPGRWVYEVKILTPAGHVLEVTLDARSLEQLGVEGGRARRVHDD